MSDHNIHEIYLLSKNSGIDHKSLAAFSNNLPRSSALRLSCGSGNKWFCALSEISFIARFRNPFIPSNAECPTIMVVSNSTNSQDIQTLSTQIDEKSKIYLEHVAYSQFELASYLNRKEINRTTLSFTYNPENDSIYLKVPHDVHTTTSIWVHENFMDYLFGSQFIEEQSFLSKSERVIATVASVEDNTFYILNCSSWKSVKSEYASLSSVSNIGDFMKANHTPIVQIKCPQLTPHFYNNQLVKTLSVISIPMANSHKFDFTNIMQGIDSRTKYLFQHTFNHPQFLSIELNSIQNIDIILTDDEGTPLKLTNEDEIFVKMYVKQMPIMSVPKPDQLIRFSSKGQENSKDCWSVTLPTSLSLHTGNWQVALASCIIPTCFSSQLSNEERMMTLSYEGYDPFNIEIPDSSTISELAYQFDHQSNGSVVGNCNDHGALTIYNQKELPLKISMSKNLFWYLGGNILEISAANQLTWKDDFETMEFSLGKSDNFVFNKPPRYEEHAPTNIFIECSILQPSIVGGKLRQILRTVPINLKQLGNVQMIEFNQLDFHSIAVTRPHTMNFRFCTSDGVLVRFGTQKKEDVLLNILFRSHQ